METKCCTKCGEVKQLTEFYYRKDTSCYIAACKCCTNKAGKKYYNDHKKEVCAQHKIYLTENPVSITTRRGWQNTYLAKNPETRKESVKNYNQSHKSEKKISGVIYYEKNKEKILKDGKEYRKNNKDKCREWHRLNKNKLYKNDANFRLRLLITTRMNKLVRGYRKAAGTIELLGMTIKDFRVYFKSKFTEGMTWDKFLSGEIHIDHIIPCATFNLVREVDQQTCFHYTNLQPLWASDNLKKFTKLPLDN